MSRAVWRSLTARPVEETCEMITWRTTAVLFLFGIV